MLQDLSDGWCIWRRVVWAGNEGLYWLVVGAGCGMSVYAIAHQQRPLGLLYFYTDISGELSELLSGRNLITVISYCIFIQRSYAIPYSTVLIAHHSGTRTKDDKVEDDLSYDLALRLVLTSSLAMNRPDTSPSSHLSPFATQPSSSTGTDLLRACPLIDTRHFQRTLLRTRAYLAQLLARVLDLIKRAITGIRSCGNRCRLWEWIPVLFSRTRAGRA